FGQTVTAAVVGVGSDGGAPVFVRQLMQGRLNADYVHAGNGPCFASVQAGAFRADTLPGGACSPEVFTPQLDASAIRVKPGEPFREAADRVDLSSAPLIVSVGRGIKANENTPMVEELAKAPAAELAASCPNIHN